MRSPGEGSGGDGQRLRPPRTVALGGQVVSCGRRESQRSGEGGADAPRIKKRLAVFAEGEMCGCRPRTRRALGRSVSWTPRELQTATAAPQGASGCCPRAAPAWPLSSGRSQMPLPHTQKPPRTQPLLPSRFSHPSLSPPALAFAAHPCTPGEEPGGAAPAPRAVGGGTGGRLVETE